MFSKIPSLFADWTMTITQSPHGTQNNLAIDFRDEPLIAPFDGCKIIKHGAKGTTGEYFDVLIPNTNGTVFLECVHYIPTKGINGIFKAGEVMGNPVPSNPQKKFNAHLHVALNINTKWVQILDYIDRRTKLELGFGFKDVKWKDWSTWNDKAIQFLSPVNSFLYPEQPKPPIINIPIENITPIPTPPTPEIPSELEIAKDAIKQCQETVSKQIDEINQLRQLLEEKDKKIESLLSEIKESDEAFKKCMLKLNEKSKNKPTSVLDILFNLWIKK